MRVPLSLLEIIAVHLLTINFRKKVKRQFNAGHLEAGPLEKD